MDSLVKYTDRSQLRVNYLHTLDDVTSKLLLNSTNILERILNPTEDSEQPSANIQLKAIDSVLKLRKQMLDEERFLAENNKSDEGGIDFSEVEDE